MCFSHINYPSLVGRSCMSNKVVGTNTYHRSIRKIESFVCSYTYTRAMRFNFYKTV